MGKEAALVETEKLKEWGVIGSENRTKDRKGGGVFAWLLLFSVISREHSLQVDHDGAGVEWGVLSTGLKTIVNVCQCHFEKCDPSLPRKI